MTGRFGSVKLSPVAQSVALAQQRLERLLGLSPDQARRAVLEMLDCFSRTIDDYIAERYRELSARGARNEAIYATIAEELEGWRFAAPRLTPRQIRRRIYG